MIEKKFLLSIAFSRKIMSRRRSLPWIHRWSRVLIGAIAIVGALTTGYLTLSHFQGQSVACPTSGCESVLSSQYAKIGGLPLSLFGALAYAAMALFALGPLAVNANQNRELRKKLEEWTWILLLVGAVSMVVFSGYLMFLLFFKINAGICVYCIASAIFTVSMLLLTLTGREWPDSRSGALHRNRGCCGGRAWNADPVRRNFRQNDSFPNKFAGTSPDYDDLWSRRSGLS